MPLIDLITPQTAQGPVADTLGDIEAAWGQVPGGLQLLANSPYQLDRMIQNIQYYQGHARFSAPLLTFIRLLLAEAVNCEYCIGMNEGMLLQAGFDLEVIQAAKRDPEQVPLEAAEKRLLGLMLKAVESPKAVTREDLDEAAAAGWSETEILDAIAYGTSIIAFDTLVNTYKLVTPDEVPA